jgi:hypothetical protein
MSTMQSKEPDFEQKVYQAVFIAFAAVELCNFYRFLPPLFRVVGVPVVMLCFYFLANVVYEKTRQK